MNKIIEYLKKYWYALVLVGLVIGFFIGRATISNSEADVAITQAESDTRLNELKNRLDTYYLNRISDSSLVIQRLHEKVSLDLKVKIKLDSKIADDKVLLARKDSNKNCNDALDAQGKVIFDMWLRAYNDSISLYQCNFQKGIKDSIIKSKEAAFQKQIIISKNLEKTLGKISAPPIVVPWLEVGYSSFGYVSAGGGIYYHNLGVGVMYETDFIKKGFSIGMNIKF